MNVEPLAAALSLEVAPQCRRESGANEGLEGSGFRVECRGSHGVWGLGLEFTVFFSF